MRPWRSVLYIPGSKERALDKARGLDVDAIIFDLEDAVAVAEKDAARETLSAALRGGGYGSRARIVRINGFDTPWGADDLDAVAELEPDAILLPKVNSADDIRALDGKLRGDTRIWAMMETTHGVFNAAEIALAPKMQGFVLGTNDLAAEIGCETGGDRLPLMMAMQTCLAAARMGGIACVDGVFNAFKDEGGLRAECEQGRSLGMDGKTLIHPAQVAICNEVFTPSPDKVELARRQIAAFEEAEAKGQGVAVVDGKIVENLHVATARKTLAKAGVNA
ncbi:(3S)-malyl-CoA thioesterase [Rhodobacteraceae bacterium THAF1]|uniref:HpcH/HpaI aldolase/citrate lyase family protein n=1 Tax=Palleronia sp. THAF1 TaxID=2587842 RepID=UPI000F3ABD38|nr:CoA ester lyase [Palleronia sp. THAF1]QFU07854.1 (3S)-malyl-CoA thioesterase [Palleronia sp. THAF1]VDC25688.1 (3S)-malyl-CoA thioesterase [Rhodobacteraceae bacterium THAF1]